MSLYEVKLRTECLVCELKLTDEKTKLRLMELGLIKGTKVVVQNKSLLKKTLLISFSNSCFTLKDNLAKLIEVKYA